MLRYLFLLLIAMLPLPARAQLTDIELTNITVMADRALAIPLSHLASQYSRDHHMTIAIGYAPSFEQTLAIQEGESADLFISAHPKSLDHLKQRGLFDVTSLRPIVRANLSLIYNGNKAELPDTQDMQKLLEKPDSFVAIASPAATAEGYFAQQVVRKLLGAGHSIAEMQDTESMLELLKKSKDHIFALMFEPDALLNVPEDIVMTVPGALHDPAVFISAVIPGDSTEPARKFQAFLQSEEAQREFIKYRFYPAVDAPLTPYNEPKR